MFLINFHPTVTTERPISSVNKCKFRWNSTNSGLILGSRPANERRRYKVTPSLIGRAQIYYQHCNCSRLFSGASRLNLFYSILNIYWGLGKVIGVSSSSADDLWVIHSISQMISDVAILLHTSLWLPFATIGRLGRLVNTINTIHHIIWLTSKNLI